MINFIESTEELNPIVLDENIYVYRDVLPDVQNLYRIIRESEASGEGKYYLKTWDPWAHFGTYSQAKGNPDEIQSAEKGSRFDEEKYFADIVNETYSKVVGDYVKRTGTPLPESSRFSGCSFCKYTTGIDTLRNNMTMQYHTDFIISQKDMPGEKFYITCTMYINDDYDGGDIEFFINGKVINHKPQAGDIVIFPSGEPYYHGVKTINSTEKFFVRNFIMYDYDGSPEWLENQKRYGAYKWAKMELDRIENEDPRNMLYIKEGNTVEYDEVYQG